MSTPTTAVATLPHYHLAHQAHHQAHHHPSSSSTANYRTAAANSFLYAPTPSVPTSSNAARLLPLDQPGGRNAGYTSSDAVTQNHQPQSPPAPPPHDHDHDHDRHLARDHGFGPSTSTTPRRRIHHNHPSAMGSTTVTATATSTAAVAVDDHDAPSRKRRRSREPDWNTFYRNGLPKEIIVIDDTPEPEANTSRKLASSNTHAAAASYEPAKNARQPLKRRRRDAPASGYHVQYVGSRTSTPRQHATPNGSTLSSDRTNSFLNTTAPTSLSSNSQYDEVPTPLKRKRTTRQQAANEAKRRDVDGLGGRLLTYKPPPFPPKKVADVQVRVVHDHYAKNTKVDDDDGHYIVVPDAELTEKYEITRLLGQGTFGKVVQARDRKRNQAVAVKIIRSVQKYRDASRIELRVLATLKANDASNRYRCIHLTDCFDYRGHICIVMDLLGQSVFDFLKGNGFVPFPNSHIQNFARQLFTSVAFLHDLNLIHTDLKPENILLCDDLYQTFTYNRKIPSSSTTINRQASQRRVLLNTEIRLIDFGSATFQDEYHSSIVSTRHYRAPEIILGLGWSFPCDIWSIGCILVEFFTGDALFQTHDNLEHLAMMEAVVGSRIDSHLVQSVNKMSTRSGGNPASKYFKRLRLDYPLPETTRGSRRFVKAMKRLHDIIPSSNQFFKHFLDLLQKIFVYDPARRITAKQALNHPWFDEIAQPDDGTEAAKIRQERKRLEQEKARCHQHYTA
ncbi:Protein kinase-like domain protein [Metarhizium rileyi]|uniref:dual-specificity kinase n=1 Tax=Metarhizium rileyi (strain RCEF 4871) TaxID=1649241 RepID=A0A167F3R4_METRR|nr:Protein kinase-like domain protein [Metarhizium rileyi RCEF 4871]